MINCNCARLTSGSLIMNSPVPAFAYQYWCFGELPSMTQPSPPVDLRSTPPATTAAPQLRACAPGLSTLPVSAIAEVGLETVFGTFNSPVESWACAVNCTVPADAG